MSATRDERANVLVIRDDHDKSATARGHRLTWKLGENATRRGHAYFYVGTCRRCRATVQVGVGWSSSEGPTDAREGRCRSAALTRAVEEAQDRHRRIVNRDRERQYEGDHLFLIRDSVTHERLGVVDSAVNAHMRFGKQHRGDVYIDAYPDDYREALDEWAADQKRSTKSEEEPTMADINGEATDPGAALQLMKACADTFDGMRQVLEQTISNAEGAGVAGDPIATMRGVDEAFAGMKTRCETAAGHFQRHCDERDRLAADPALAATQKNTWLRGDAA